MPELDPPLGIDPMIGDQAQAISRAVLGRDLTPDEAEAMKSIFRAAAQALKEGFIQRLSRHVQAERKEEAIEGFFEDQIKTD
jgi:hypothetical protein